MKELKVKSMSAYTANNPKDTYVLEVHHEHGDADYHTEDTHTYKRESKAIVMYHFVRALSGYDKFDAEHSIKELIVDMCCDLGITLRELCEIVWGPNYTMDTLKYVDDYLIDELPANSRDLTCEDYRYATVDKIYLWYYNNNGTRYLCEV